MTLKTSHHERALAAAAGLVGRPRLRAGLVLTLVAACGPGVLDSDSDSPSGDEGPGSTDAATTAAATTTTSESGSDGATGSSGEGASTTGEPATTSATSEATLLTDATTLATTTEMTTGGTTEMSTGEATTGTDSSGTTGELEDCADPRTGEVDWMCCELQDWQPAPQCTPWGPPAPPSAGRDVLALARAARGRWV